MPESKPLGAQRRQSCQQAAKTDVGASFEAAGGALHKTECRSQAFVRTRAGGADARRRVGVGATALAFRAARRFDHDRGSRRAGQYELSAFDRLSQCGFTYAGTPGDLSRTVALGQQIDTFNRLRSRHHRRLAPGRFTSEEAAATVFPVLRHPVHQRAGRQTRRCPL